MGFFSWLTNDTKKSIWNKHSDHKTFRVYMKDNKGNVWIEDDYDGYGVFGGKDFYVLLAEMNGHEGSKRTLRNIGIDLWSGNKDILWSNLMSNKNSKWRNEEPENSPNQGYFPW
jgi:hypothetical protein